MTSVIGMPEMILSETVKSTFKDAAQKLTGYRRRDFMAKVAEDYFNGSARKVETFMGWNRDSVQLGLHERRTGLICVDNYRVRGRHKSEILLPNLEADIRSKRRSRVPGRPQVSIDIFVCPDHGPRGTFGISESEKLRQ